MANIKRVSDGSFKITVSCGRDENGKQIRKYITYHPEAKTPRAAEKEAKAYADKIEERIKEGRYFTGDQLTYREVYEQWAAQWAADNLTQAQIEQYTEIINRDFLPEFGHVKINQISAVSVQHYVNELRKRLAPATLKKYFVAFRSVFKYAHRLNIISEDICNRIELPKLVKGDDIEAFTVEEAKRFMTEALTTQYQYSYHGYSECHAVPFQFQVLFILAIYSGCRRGELVALNWADIDTAHNQIHITKAVAKTKEHGVIIKDPKTKSGIRTLTLPVVCFDLLTQLEAEQRIKAAQMGSAWQGLRGKDFKNNPVFIQDNGERMHPDTVTHKFTEIIRQYNKTVDDDKKLPEIHMHNLRHTAASLLVAEGVDMATIAKRMGHRKISTTLDIYTHPYDANDSSASEVLGRLLDADQEPAEAPERPETISVSISPAEYDILLSLRKMSPHKRDKITELIINGDSAEMISSAAADMRSNVIRS